ncbi:MAG: amidohydrolase family protein [Treponema sp.]|jgi:5-methylthioadenosine/S-adenosylhomocysteine deaminase|nr:amidohydrolase family protein [Treponema sp.]
MYDLGLDQVIIVSKNYGYKPFIGAVCVQDSRIGEVRNYPVTRKECREWIDGKGGILMPGLVNGHCHGDMTLGRGFGDDMTLREQNEAFRPHKWFRKFINDDDRFYARQLTYCEALLSGTTFICENMYWGLGSRSIQAMTETGICGALVEDIRLDFEDPDTFVSDKALRDFTLECQENAIVPVIGLIAEEDYEYERLRRIFEKLADLEALQTLHLAENEWRRDIIEKKYGHGPVDYLARQGFLHDRLIGSHVVRVSDSEIRQLEAARVKVVNTPLCEMKIADGIAPIPGMVRRGITVGLGTDGSLWNNSNDIFREMKGMALLHTVSGGIRSLSKEDILDMATVNGAAVFGREKEFGMIKEGMKANMILIDTDKPHMRPLLTGKHENVISSIVFNATGGDVTDVFIGGKRIVKEGRLTTVDVSVITAKVQQAAEKIADAI